jgi:TonB family protein
MQTVALCAAMLLNAAAEPPKNPVTRAAPVGGTFGLVDLIKSEDYPPDALREGKVGAVHVRLDVDREGRVSKCVLLEPTGTESLDTAACRLMQERARFTPARDARTGGCGFRYNEGYLAPVGRGRGCRRGGRPSPGAGSNAD